MKIYKSKYRKLPGSSYDELVKLARREYHLIQKKTPRRQPYIRSKYFTKDKIFVSQFWDHLSQKIPVDRVRRLKFYRCAIDLLRHSIYSPEINKNPNKPNEALHRFAGVTKDGMPFYVSDKGKQTYQQKRFISVFPAKMPKK